MKSASGILALLGRLAFEFYFLNSVQQNVWVEEQRAVHRYPAFYESDFELDELAALVINWAGALCLISGFQARIAGLVMAIYLTAVTLIFHKYWIIANEMSRATMFMHFQKNLGIIGGLLMGAALGPGAWAIGERQQAGFRG